MYLAKGGDLKQMVAELYGKATGCAKGKAGSMHLTDVAHGVMGTSAVVGTNIANAVGYAYAIKLQRKNSIVVSFFGDGATEEGVYHESLNFAALKSLPLIFICENNSYAVHTHQSKRQKELNIYERVRPYGIKAERIEDDVLGVHDSVSKSVNALRRGEPGPFFFECLTYRWKEHVGPNDDFGLGYRTLEEADPWMKNDQVQRMAAMIDSEQRKQIEREVEAEIEAAFLFAEESPFPTPDELFTDVFKEA
jgi:TPP-dependent pyruvate/acetoin dehydrogenase alpha subunit